MILIACVDDSYGMMFNHRRVSMDRIVIGDIMNSFEHVSADEYSKPLFPEGYISEDTAVLFVEDPERIPDIAQIDEIILYHWNRRYPLGQKFPIEILQEFELTDSFEFVGYSHDKITKEIYENRIV